MKDETLSTGLSSGLIKVEEKIYQKTIAFGNRKCYNVQRNKKRYQRKPKHQHYHEEI